MKTTTTLRMTTLALLALSGAALGTLAPAAAATASCHWNDRDGSVVWTVEHDSGGFVDFKDGSPCTVGVDPRNAPDVPRVPNASPLGCVPVEWRLFEPSPCPI